MTPDRTAPELTRAEASSAFDRMRERFAAGTLDGRELARLFPAMPKGPAPAKPKTGAAVRAAERAAAPLKATAAEVAAAESARAARDRMLPKED